VSIENTALQIVPDYRLRGGVSFHFSAKVGLQHLSGNASLAHQLRIWQKHADE
jgi:hypothetical protein